MCRMTIDIDGSHLQGGICLVQKDGTLSERGFRDVQAIFGWSEWDWSKWDQDPETFAGAAVQAVVETVQGEKSEFSSIRYVNPPGGGQRLEKANAKGLAARYGAKTRALFGGSTPVTAGGSAGLTTGGTPAAPGRPFDSAQGRPAAPRPPAPPMAKPPPPPPSQASTSTMEECWGVFCKRNDGKPELELYGLWADRVLAETGKTQNDCGPEDWGKLMESLTTDDLPY
jgi:hypothetical protein